MRSRGTDGFAIANIRPNGRGPDCGGWTETALAGAVPTSLGTRKPVWRWCTILTRARVVCTVSLVSASILIRWWRVPSSVVRFCRSYRFTSVCHRMRGGALSKAVAQRRTTSRSGPLRLELVATQGEGGFDASPNRWITWNIASDLSTTLEPGNGLDTMTRHLEAAIDRRIQGDQFSVEPDVRYLLRPLNISNNRPFQYGAFRGNCRQRFRSTI